MTWSRRSPRDHSRSRADFACAAGSRPRSRSATQGEQQLMIAEHALGERGPAEREIQEPGANERFIEAERGDCRELGEEPRPPVLQRECIVRTDVVGALDAKAGR